MIILYQTQPPNMDFADASSRSCAPSRYDEIPQENFEMNSLSDADFYHMTRFEFDNLCYVGL